MKLFSRNVCSKVFANTCAFCARVHAITGCEAQLTKAVVDEFCATDSMCVLTCMRLKARTRNSKLLTMQTFPSNCRTAC